jgi:hypothetical protein
MRILFGFGVLCVAVIAVIMLVTMTGLGSYLGYKSVVAPSQQQTPPPANTVAAAGASACTAPLAGTQSLNIASYDADKPGTQITGISTTVFLGAGPALNPSGNTTQPGNSYSVLVTKGGYARTYTTGFTTSCNTLSPALGMYQETLDTAPTVTVYNVGGRTANANVLASLQTLTASSPSTLRVEFTPSALYKHIAGGVPITSSPQADSGYFAVFMNASNTTAWDTSGFNLGLNGAPAGSQWSGQCVPYTSAAGAGTPAQYMAAAPTWIKGTLVYGWVCHGDFSGQSTGIFGMDLTVKPSATYGGGNNSIGLYVVPVEYFQHTVTGALQQGASDNLGNAIDNSVNASIYIA